ncbi:two-component system chemotaxis sensor kinase CheA [Marinoscillum furvescens DSM 4134]|uniref:Chemotaxis protein CheA n=2 Tax=Marinoscillum furvescens TaxID=1026 RepID=A0A3D9L4R2_MARFU|nr:two-component system chemotaxis sensor kinase CheA [Marinoscillum furvescens DSM 4134]
MEAKDNIEQLDKLFVDLEKDHGNANAIKEIFRITHTLKGNAMGLGFEPIAQLSHVMEDVMLAIQEGKINLDQDLFKILFRANDKLGALVNALETEEKVSYLGIKTSLSLFLQKALNQKEETPDEEPADSPTPPALEAEEEKPQPVPEETGTQISFSDVIQIPVRKMDELMNEVGQLIIERDRLIAMSDELGIRSSELDRLKRITSNLQYSIMNVRMVQIGFLFNKFHRVLRDAAAIENKKVNLVLKGTEIEIDRNILKIISDSLVHLVRNAVGHGIEAASQRTTQNKPEVGTVMLDAKYERDRVVIMVTDDGGGIDHEIIRKKIVEKGLVSEVIAKNLKPEEVIQYIFESGFSNAAEVNEISGRGVGMDVVKKAVESIGGQVKVETIVGEGTTVYLHVPSSLALKGTLLFKVDDQEYAMALSYTESVVPLNSHDIYKLGSSLMTRYQEETISVVFLKDILDLPTLSAINERGVLQRSYEAIGEEAVDFNAIVVSYAGRTTAVIVDQVLQQKEIIEKPLARPLTQVRLLSGTTILGNGNVCPVIDIAALTDLLHKQALQSQHE